MYVYKHTIRYMNYIKFDPSDKKHLYLQFLETELKPNEQDRLDQLWLMS